MSQSASAAAAFYRDVAKHRTIWAIRDAAGFPTSTRPSGQTIMPFWSTRSRALRLTKAAPAYAGFTPVELSWDDFVDHWLSGLERDGLHLGLNWSGPRAVGYDMAPAEVRRNVEAVMALPLHK